MENKQEKTVETKKRIIKAAIAAIAAVVVFKGKEILEITKNKYSGLSSQKKEDNSSPK